MTYEIGQIFDEYPDIDTLMEMNQDGVAHLEPHEDGWIVVENKPYVPTTEDIIRQLKGNLESTDYLAIKFMEGYLTAEEYEPIKIQRQAWRDEINRLESEHKMDD